MGTILKMLASLTMGLLLALPTATQAVHWNQAFQICSVFEDRFADSLPMLTKEVPIGVGCELAGCCLGCPDAVAIDWQISINKDRVRAAEIHFENLDPDVFSKLTLSGSVKRLGRETLILMPGETWIRGLPRDSAAAVPVAFIKAQSAIKALQDTDHADESSQNPEGIRVTQYVAAYKVNSFAVKIFEHLCLDETLPDRLVIDNNTGNDQSAVLVDFNAGPSNGGCINDQLGEVDDLLTLGNALPSGTCKEAEVAVFSGEDAMYYERPVTSWTSSTGDTHTATLKPALIVPVKVWIGGSGLIGQAQTVQAQIDVQDSNLLFEQNRTGIQFNPSYQDFSSDLQDLVNTIGFFCPNDDVPKSVYEDKVWYTADTLNVYYLPWDFSGRSCPNDRNIIQVGNLGIYATLAHEFGHAFGLQPSEPDGHVNASASGPFGTENIMIAGGALSADGTSVLRTDFTIGQSFRLNTYNESMLNVNGNRAGELTTPCAPDTVDDTCPVLSLDVVE